MGNALAGFAQKDRANGDRGPDHEQGAWDKDLWRETGKHHIFSQRAGRNGKGIQVFSSHQQYLARIPVRPLLAS